MSTQPQDISKARIYEQATAEEWERVNAKHRKHEPIHRAIAFLHSQPVGSVAKVKIYQTERKGVRPFREAALSYAGRRGIGVATKAADGWLFMRRTE